MKKYTVKYTDRSIKDLGKMDSYTRQMIMNWISKMLDGIENPRYLGKALKGDKKGLWRYRVGDYRILSLIQDKELIILALRIGHRRDIYQR